MPRPTRTALVAVVALALAGCSVVAPDGERESLPTATPTPTPEPPTVHQGEVSVPPDATTVLDAADPVAAALRTSETLFASAPVAVVAPADDVAAQLRAASAAVALGAPLLLDAADDGAAAEAGEGTEDGSGDAASPAPTPSPDASDESAPPTDATAAELDRLEVLAVLTVGEVTVDATEDVVVVAAPQDDAALAELLGTELGAATPVAAGGEATSVAGLDRAAPALLALEGAAPPAPGAEDETTGSGTEAPGATPGATPGTSPAPSPSSEEDEAPEDEGSEESTDDAPAEAWPLTELPEAPEAATLLVTGGTQDLAPTATARAAGLAVVAVPSGDPRATSATVQAVAAAAPQTVVALGPAFGTPEELAWKVRTAATGVELPGGGQVLFPGRRMVALYGTPGTSALGMLGEQDLPGSIARAQQLAAQYQALTPDVVVPAFEIIATVAAAEATPDGNYSRELPVESFVPWVEAARDAGVYVVIDLQPGRTDFLTQAKMYEPLLRYPNVGLALDPEWRLAPDQVHLRQIGSVGIDEVNTVADWLAQLTRDNALPQKLLVLHQFRLSMVQERERLDMSHEELALMVHVDGQGSQPAKQDTWSALRRTAPEGLWWGWKNFVDEDLPMLTPEQTYGGVQPVPDFVSYQ
ncbi:hypothetical protein [Actinotalea sp. Marseille-Q4924]|uniref:hypothetical protein n=1 Tax=Actinotalea sp. Marseille-Q4924 TaxID=2866571 RepID=UPI001CE46B97|nr:hypothetical protein [Actinotalea sp. Marseille-Q4924]